MTKEEILDYVMNTPENTNRMVLNDMLNEFNSNNDGNTSVLIIHIGTEDGHTYAFDKTAGEIIEAMPLTYIVYEDDDAMTYKWIHSYEYTDGIGYAFWSDDGDSWSAATIEDYPSYTEDL